MKKLFAATLALGLLSGCLLTECEPGWLWTGRCDQRNTSMTLRPNPTQPVASSPTADTPVDNIKNAAENNPIATGLIVVGLLGALDKSVDNVTAVATATATATSTSTSTSTSTATK
jgi:hypothetical protein